MMSAAATHREAPPSAPIAPIRSPAASLFMREWGEQRWRLASLLAINLSLLLYAIIRDRDLVITTASVLLIAHAVLGTTFIAMGVAAGDRASGVLDLLRALPVAPGRIMAVKLVVGAAVCSLPIVALTVLLLGWPGLRDPHVQAEIRELMPHLDTGPYGAVALMGLLAMGSAVIAFLWAVAAGVGRSTELRAGLSAIGIGILWLVVLIAATQTRLLPTLIWFSPAAWMLFLSSDPPSLVAVSAPQALAGGALAAFSIRRYGRVRGNENRSPSAAAVPVPVSAPSSSVLHRRRTRFTAIAWKQMRETLPLAAFGLFVIAALVALSLFSDDSIQMGLDRRAGWLMLTGERLRNVTPALGFLVAVVVGVGTFTADLQPRVLEFWRSKPISPALLFWTKYVTGAAVVLLALHLPPLMLTAWWGGSHALVGDPYVGCVPLMHLTTYTVAVFMACWLRRTVYAGILAFGAAIALILVPAVEPALDGLDVVNVMRRLDGLRTAGATGIDGWLNDDYLPYLFTEVALTAALSVTAWQVMRRNARAD